MIATVSIPKSDAAGAVSGSEAAGATGDIGAFDALLTLQGMVDGDAAAATILAGDVGVPAEDQRDDAGDEPDAVVASAEDSLWFLAALPPMTLEKKSEVAVGTGVTAGPSGTPARNDATAALTMVPLTAGDSTTGDATITQTFSAEADSGASDRGSTPTPTPIATSSGATTTVLDAASWNNLSGPAELFAHGTRHAAPERMELNVHAKTSDPRWADELGARIATLVRTGDSSASIQLTPVDLGPVEVNVSVRDSQATVHFGAASAETRALLEASMPRLREMLAAQGFQLMDSSVSHGFARQTRHESAGTPRANAEIDSPVSAAHAIHVNGLLDLYA